jgi:hypothetical protein
MRMFDIPPLEGYTSLPEAGQYLKVTRQRIYQMGVEDGAFLTIRAVAGAGPRPAAYVVQNAEMLWHRSFQCPECKALAADGEEVLYCVHTGKDVPPVQASELRARLSKAKAQEALAAARA